MTVLEIMKAADSRVHPDNKAKRGIDAVEAILQEMSGARHPQYLYYEVCLSPPGLPTCPDCHRIMRREVDQDVDGVVHIHWTCNCTPTEAEIDSVR